MNANSFSAKLAALWEAAASDWKWAVRFGVLSAAFLSLFIPVQARLDKASKALAQRQHDIEVAKKAGLNLLSAAELQKIQERASRFESGYILLSQVTSVLDHISDEANGHHLRVIRIHSESPAPLRDATGAEVLMKGKKLSRLPIRLRLETNFRNLGEFVKSLKNSKQVFAYDEMILERAPGEGENNLRCDLTMSFFSV